MLCMSDRQLHLQQGGDSQGAGTERQQTAQAGAGRRVPATQDTQHQALNLRSSYC